jgi:hypothetical protein
MTTDDLHDLASECEVIVRYLGARGSSEDAAELNGALESAKRSRSKLKTLRRDLGEWCRGLSAAHQAELRALLLAATGAERTNANERAVEVIKRGRISSREDYEILRTWLEFADADAVAPDLIARADALLTLYSTKA